MDIPDNDSESSLDEQHHYEVFHQPIPQLGLADPMVQALQVQQQSQGQALSYIGRSFASEKDLRIWVAQEFGGMVNIHGKKFWRSGDNLAKYKSWTCSCKHEKKAGCKFKLYIAWTNKTIGPVIKTSHAVHTGHPIDMHEHRRSEYGLDNEYGQTGISEEVYAKIITSMQNRENQCKRKLAYNYCQQAFDKFLTRELDLIAPAAVRRKVNDFIAAASTPEPPPAFHV